MKQRAGYCLVGAIVSIGLAGVKAPAGGQIYDATDNYDSGHSRLWLRVNYELPYLPGPNNYMTLYALRGIGFTSQNISDVLPLLISYRDALALRASDMGQVRMDRIHGEEAADLSTMYVDAERRFRSRADKIWATCSDRVGPEKTARLRELCGDAVIVTVTTTAYMDDHLGNIDRLLGDWDREAREQAAAVQQTTVVQEQVATTPPAPAPAPAVEAPAPAPAPAAEAPAPAPTTIAPAPEAAPPAAPAPRRRSRSRMHRRVRGLG